MVRKPARCSSWYDVGWALVAGLVGAAGLLLAYLGMGLLGTVVAFALMELTVAPIAWSLMTEAGRSGRPAILELAPMSALATVVTLGLVDGLGFWAFGVLALVVATCPLLREGRRRALLHRYGSDRSEMRSEFEAIVALSFGTDRTES
jgi:hypothetical protein